MARAVLVSGACVLVGLLMVGSAAVAAPPRALPVAAATQSVPSDLHDAELELTAAADWIHKRLLSTTEALASSLSG